MKLNNKQQLRLKKLIRREKYNNIDLAIKSDIRLSELNQTISGFDVPKRVVVKLYKILNIKYKFIRSVKNA